MFIRIIYTFLLLLVSPYFLYRLYRKKSNHPPFGKRWKEHFGMTPALKHKEPVLWIHAVSVGESILATSLIKKIKAEHPEQSILVTTTTSTGAAEIAKLGNIVEHRYMPIDFGWAVKRFINKVRPARMLIIETELWPNTLHYVHKANIPITVINARLSEKSCNNYRKVLPLFRLMHPKLNLVLCQTKTDANRFAQLGVEATKLQVTGSIKFDIHISDEIKYAGKQLREQLGKSRPVWIAASTHQGEDEQLLQAHEQLLRKIPDCLLILVPRHPERFDQVFELCLKGGFKTVRRSTRKMPKANEQIYLGDSMGELLILLGAADICFMGGSLLGNKVGGHNMLEPAALGIPTLTGPSYYNFKEITEQLLSHHAILLCDNVTDITASLEELLVRSGDSERHRIAASALKIVQQNQGSLEKTIHWI